MGDTRDKQCLWYTIWEINSHVAALSWVVLAIRTKDLLTFVQIGHVQQYRRESVSAQVLRINCRVEWSMGMSFIDGDANSYLQCMQRMQKEKWTHNRAHSASDDRLSSPGAECTPWFCCTVTPAIRP
jgi:hypothetical protein